MASLEEAYVLSSYASTSTSDAWQIAVTPLLYEEEPKSEVSAKSLGKQRTTNGRSVSVQTVQRSAVHLVDLAEQAPLASFTVSPSTVFTAKAVSASSPAAIDLAVSASPSTSAVLSTRTRRTFAAIQHDGQYEICCWTEEVTRSGAGASEPLKQTLPLASKIVALDVSAFPGSLLAFSEDGGVMLLNFQLEVKAQGQLAAQRLSRQAASMPVSSEMLAGLGFLDTTESISVSAHAIFTSSAAPKVNGKEKKNKRKSLSSGEVVSEQASLLILAVDKQKSTVRLLASIALPEVDTVDLAFVGSGLGLASISRSGRFATHSVKPRASVSQHTLQALLASNSSSTVTLDIVSRKTIDFASTKLDTSQASLLSLSSIDAPTLLSPFVVLIGAQPGSPERLQSLLLDTEYGLMLVKQQIQLPSPPNRPLSTAQLDLDHVVVACSSGSGQDGAASARRSLVQAAVCSVPLRSTLADLIGTQAMTQSFVAVDAVSSASESLSPSQQALLHALQEHLGAEKVVPANIKAAEVAFQSYVSTDKVDGKLQLPPRAVRQILELVVAPSRPAQPIASGIATTLISAGLVADSSLQAGLTSAVLAKEEWQLVSLCLAELQDIPETTMVAALRGSCQSVKVALEAILRLIVKAPSTATELRKALRAGLGSAELEKALSTVASWLQPATEPASAKKSSTVPGTDLIVPFMQALLDAHLVTILQSRSLHPLLLSISASLYGQIEFSASILSLRGPLAEISRIHQVQVKEEKDRKARMKELGGKTGKSHKKLKDDPEERWKAKQKLQESTMLVGDYALEEFLL